MSLEVDGVWKTGVWATTVWADGVWREGEAPPAPEPEVVVQRGRSGRRYRIIEDPDKIVEEIRVQEKKVEKDKRQLKIIAKRASSPNVEGALYQHFQHKIEKLEAKIDDRMERIAMLIAQLEIDDDDDEEVLLLS